jgi:ribosomal protein L7/L12
VTDLTPQPAAQPPAGQGGFRVYPDATQAYDVALGATGAKKVNVIKVIRELTGWNLQTAKIASEKTPTLILQNVTSAVADDAIQRLAAQGATPIKVASGEPLPNLTPGLFTPAGDQAVVPYGAPDPVRSAVATPPVVPPAQKAKRGVPVALVAVLLALSLAVSATFIVLFLTTPRYADSVPEPVVLELPYQGQDMTGSDWSDGWYDNFDFSYSTLTNADFSGSDLNNAVFDHVVGPGADFSNVTANAATFFEASLAGADFLHATLNGANFSSASLPGADFSNASLAGAILNSANLAGADLTGADLAGADLMNVNLAGANLDGADLAGAQYNDNTIWPEGFTPPASAVHVG